MNVTYVQTYPYDTSNDDLQRLTALIDEINERLEVLSDACYLDEIEKLWIELCGIQYILNTAILGVCEDNANSSAACTFACQQVQSTDEYVFEASEAYAEMYLNILRSVCAETHTFTFQEAEPEEYAEAKAAEERDKNAPESFTFSQDRNTK